MNIALEARGHTFEAGSLGMKLIKPSLADRVNRPWTRWVVLMLSTGVNNTLSRRV